VNLQILGSETIENEGLSSHNRGQAHAWLVKMCKNMLLSLSFLRKAVIGCSLASALSLNCYGASSYAANGGEYAIAGALASEQMESSVAISPNGGFIVWQDNVTDGDGLGIRALRLDSGFSGVLSPFRVNQTGSGDQEKPAVALLNGGGAVFVWQGGSFGFQRIFVRFLSATNTWMSGDIEVSSSAAEFQVNASVAVLKDGNVAVVWAGYNQGGSGTMQDVFCQLFSPTGAKVGSEFRVNQFPAYNQRTPSVAALSGGGFVVAWISEQQRLSTESVTPADLLQPDARPSVDVFARAFEKSGTAASSELMVNTNVLTCANPAIAGASDGGFVVVWSEVNTAILEQGWDIYSRKFASPASGDGVCRVNTMLYGEQFAPQVSRAGEDFLVVWNSLGQDGSFEGVYGQFLAANGSKAGDEFRVNSVTVSKQLHPTVASDGTGQFLVAWSGFVGGARTYDLFAQRYLAAGQALEPMGAPYVMAPFFVSNGAYEPRLQVTWPTQDGLAVDHYEIYLDGQGTAVASTTSNSWTMTSSQGLTANSTHSFQVRYELIDGRRSPLSAAASGTTWSGYNWGGIPFEWMTDNFGADVSSWPPAGRLLALDGPTVLQVYLSGGTPSNPQSWLKVKLEPTAQGLFLSWNPRPGLIYQVQKSTDLTQWLNVGGQRLATGASDSVQVTQGSGCYYRVVLMR
jgi:acylphosphatase